MAHNLEVNFCGPKIVKLMSNKSLLKPQVYTVLHVHTIPTERDLQKYKN